VNETKKSRLTIAARDLLVGDELFLSRGSLLILSEPEILVMHDEDRVPFQVCELEAEAIDQPGASFIENFGANDRVVVSRGTGDRAAAGDRK
jgi:hypothetical protein